MSSTQLRADAQRNRERVLDAAHELIAERGCDVSVDEIARRAGVGHATVFRRFPTKEALVAAVISQQIGELVAVVEESLAEPDPGEAFRSFVWHVGELHARDRGLHEGFSRCSGAREVADAKAELNGLVEQLIERAQQAGALRLDVDADDVSALVGSAIRGASGSGEPEVWRRYVEVVLDGLRPPAGA
ncbi:MAG TPA: TetR/AcrR family transcriptional regulator [Gaiellaceae bacterium]